MASTLTERRYKTPHRRPTELPGKRSNKPSSPASSRSTTSAPPRKNAASSAGCVRTIRIPQEPATKTTTKTATVTDRRYKAIEQVRKPLPNPQSPILWHDRLPDQVAILRKLIAGSDKSVVTPDAESLSALFGRKNKNRTEQIEGILETLKGLGQL